MNFSVLMSLYVKENPQFLVECFESLKNQSLQANEIILVFDGKLISELEHVVEKYAKILPIKIVRLSENVGLGKALNEGLKYCSHDWVFRMDTDDICHPERFEKQIEYLKKNPDVSVLGTQIQEFSETMQKMDLSRIVPTHNEDIVKFAKKRCPLNHMTVAYKKSIIQQVGSYKHHLLMEDYNLWLRIIAAEYRIENLPEVLVFVRAGRDMVKRRRGIKYVKSEWKLSQIKINLGIQNHIQSYSLFLLRSIPRLLPSFILEFIYKKLRK